jgi:hypothetical protein
MNETIVRWTASRKLKVLEDLAKGNITEQQAIEKYSLSLEEILSWKKAFFQGGEKCLTVKKLNALRTWRLLENVNERSNP